MALACLSEQQKLLELQQLQEGVLVVVGRHHEDAFVLGDVVDDRLIVSWSGDDQNNGEDNQEGLRRVKSELRAEP